MVSKKSLIVVLLVVAVLLSVFSLVMSFSSDSESSKDGSRISDLGGNVNLEILPAENAPAMSDGDSQ